MGKKSLIIMKNIENNKIINSIIWNGMASGLNLILGMVITPLVTNNIGAEAYGYISLASNFITYVTILTTALNSYATRYISVEYHMGDMKKSNIYFNSVLYTNLVAGTVIFAVLMGIVYKLEYILVIPKNLVRDVKILFIFMFLNFFSLLIGNTFLVSVYIKNRLDLSGFFKTIAYLLQIVLVIISFKYLSPHLWYVGGSYFIFSTCILISSLGLYKNLTSELKIEKRLYSWNAVRTLVIHGVWNSINSLGNVLNSGLDLIVSNLMLTPILMSQISIAKTIGGIVCVLYQLVSQIFQPQLLKTYAENNKEKLLFQLQIAMKTSGCITGIFFIGFFLLGNSFYELWIPNQDTKTVYQLTVVTLLSFLLEGVVGPLYYIYTLTVKNKIPCIITVIGGILNVLSMFILLKYTELGAYAVVGTTTVIMIFINLITNPLYMTCCLKIKWYSFYPTILRYLLFCFICTSTLKFSLGKFISASWMNLIGFGFCICIVGVILYFIIVLNKEEKRILIMNIFHRRS